MSKRAYGMLTGLIALSATCFVNPANALTMKQCSEKYRSATDTGTAGDLTWNEFRKAECGPGATMAMKKTKVKAAAGSTATGPSEKECSARYQDAKKSGTLGGMSWNEFRSAGCVAKSAAIVPPAAAEKTARTTTKSEKTATPSTAPAKVSEKECSQRYQAAKSAGTLSGMTWNQFRSNGCPETIAARSGSMMPTMGSIFPTTISKKYTDHSPGRARLLTCRDQYEANKAAGVSEPKWTEEGGGYYSECNKRLSQQ